MSGNFVRRDQQSSDLDEELYSELKAPVSRQGKKKKGGCGWLLFVFFVFAVLLVVGVFYLDRSGMLKSFSVSQLIPSKKCKVLLSLQPKDAQLYLNDELLELTPVGENKFSFSVSQGTYKLVAKKQGFREFCEDIDVPVSGEIVAGDIILAQKRPGTLNFKYFPADARIIIDGNVFKPQEEGAGVGSFSDLPPGKHSLIVRKPGYKPWKKDFNLPADDGVELGTVSLEASDWKPIEIEVTPHNVEVFVDGEKVEISVIREYVVTEPLEPGKHNVEIKAEGFSPWVKENFEIFSDITNSLGPIVLSPVAKAEKDVEKTAANSKEKDKSMDKNAEAAEKKSGDK